MPPPSTVDALHTTMMNMLARELRHLRTRSLGGQLKTSDSNTLVKYAKLLMDMKKIEDDKARREAKEAEETLKAKSAEDLEAIVSGAGK